MADLKQLPYLADFQNGLIHPVSLKSLLDHLAEEYKTAHPHRQDARSLAHFLFQIIVLFLSILLGGRGFASQELPEITNSNPNATAYFWLKKSGGEGEIIKVPPQSQLALPKDAVEIQYLYMEGGLEEEENNRAVPELSTFRFHPPTKVSKIRYMEEALEEAENNRAVSELSTFRPRPSDGFEIQTDKEEDANWRTRKSPTPKRSPYRKEIKSHQPPKKVSKIRQFFEESW